MVFNILLVSFTDCLDINFIVFLINRNEESIIYAKCPQVLCFHWKTAGQG